MAQAPIKVPDLPQKNTVAASDRFVIVGNTTGTADVYSIKISNCVGNSEFLPTRSTPTNSTSTAIQGGAMFTDGSYFYVATANNVVKRVALSTF